VDNSEPGEVTPTVQNQQNPFKTNKNRRENASYQKAIGNDEKAQHAQVKVIREQREHINLTGSGSWRGF